MKCSIIIPVYNEKQTICEIIARLQKLTIDKEIIVVDDFSTDGTREKLKQLSRQQSGSAFPTRSVSGRVGGKDIKLICHNKNLGKGEAIKTGLKYATGDIFMVQDADLEYSPEEIPKLLEPIIKGDASVVYGSRIKGKGKFALKSYLANRFLTSLTNILYGSKLTDMETCYKCVKMEIVKNLSLEAKRFEFEPEITVKLLKRKFKIYEIPITYCSRQKNKKIGFKDGIEAMKCLFRCRFHTEKDK